MFLFKFVVGIVCSVISCPWRAPVDPDYRPTRYGPQNWEQADLAREALQGVEDDMRFNEEVEPSYAGINGSNYRWPQKTLIYEFDSNVAKDQKLTKLVADAIKQIEKETCIRFKKRSNEKDYVRIMNDPGKCYSYVGVQPRRWQPQDMSLADGCKFIGTVVHEFGHALGLFHEHQRSDRDNFITVYEKNVDPAAMHNFNKTKPVDEMTFGAKYDCTSIMHYGRCAFTKNSTECEKNQNLSTMIAKDGTKLLEPYDRPGLNKNDIALLKKLYNC